MQGLYFNMLICLSDVIPECEEIMVEAVANDLFFALSTIDMLMEKQGDSNLPLQLVLPVALVSLVCAV